MAIEKKDYVKELLDKKNKEFNNTGKMTFTDQDLVQAVTGENNEPVKSESEVVNESLNEISVVNKDEIKLDDKLLEEASKDVNEVVNIDKDIEITPEIKHKFVDSIISNSRFSLGFDIFNGISLTIRSRTQAEAEACYKLIGDKAVSLDIKTQADYVNLVRRVLIAIQLESFKGETYEVVPINSDAFNDRMDTITSWGVGVVTAIYRRLVEFESIYWVMVANADNVNFWSPAESS